MTPEELKALARRALEGVWSADGQIDPADVYAVDVVSHQHSHPAVDDVVGLDGLVQFIGEFHVAFPDFTDRIERQVAEGDTVVTHFTSRGTNQGELLGLEPSGRTAEWMGIEIARVADGKIVENWVSWDMYGMLQQLGSLPAT